MLPLLPCSTLSRSKRFVGEEWEVYFSNGKADVEGGWRGVLYANLAIVNPQASWDFFAQDGFNANWLDGGASRTWYLALAAGEFLLPKYEKKEANPFAFRFGRWSCEQLHGQQDG